MWRKERCRVVDEGGMSCGKCGGLALGIAVPASAGSRWWVSWNIRPEPAKAGTTIRRFNHPNRSRIRGGDRPARGGSLDPGLSLAGNHARWTKAIRSIWTHGRVLRRCDGCSSRVVQKWDSLRIARSVVRCQQTRPRDLSSPFQAKDTRPCSLPRLAMRGGRSGVVASTW